jgi:putative oxidoreductase
MVMTQTRADRADTVTLARREDWALAIVRVAAGIVFLVHGAQKLFMFGIDDVGGGFAQMGIPAPAVAALLVTVLELAGGAALIAGLFTRWFAALFAVEMLVATLLVHLENGFFVSDNGFEFTFTLLALALALAVGGAGRPAVDSLLERQRIMVRGL